MSDRSQPPLHKARDEADFPESNVPHADAEFDEIDRLYRQALEAVDAFEAGNDDDSSVPPGAARSASSPESQDAEAASRPASPAHGHAIRIDSPQDLEAGPAVTPRQVIEAALFVGGKPLTGKRLCGLLRGDFDAEFVQQTIDDLNARYHQENRPYEIRSGEGGYRMQLRSEFGPVRDRVYGLGPKEVRLSHEALEVLALVAYKQPITRAEMERAAERRNIGSLLRQLLRRELIALQRDGDDPREVTYRTTPRFLQLFGIHDVTELPRAEELSFK